MRRADLLEIHDQPWFPGFLRDHVTDALQFLLNVFRVYRPIVPRLQRAVRQTGARQILDLCSGAGGPWPWLLKDLDDRVSPVNLLLTDKYPHAQSFPRNQPADAGIHFHPGPVDATQVPAELSGFRTIFSSFHHFSPSEARGILQDAVEKRRGIAVFEAPGRYPVTILLLCLMPLGYFLLAPFQRPFRWSRLFWTYLLPVIPFVLFYDGIVSCLRIYSPRELHELVAALPANNYQWEIGVERGGLLRVPISYLIGLPPAAQPTMLNPAAAPVLP